MVWYFLHGLLLEWKEKGKDRGWGFDNCFRWRFFLKGLWQFSFF